MPSPGPLRTSAAPRRACGAVGWRTCPTAQAFEEINRSFRHRRFRFRNLGRWRDLADPKGTGSSVREMAKQAAQRTARGKALTAQRRAHDRARKAWEKGQPIFAGGRAEYGSKWTLVYLSIGLAAANRPSRGRHADLPTPQRMTKSWIEIVPRAPTSPAGSISTRTG